MPGEVFGREKGRSPLLSSWRSCWVVRQDPDREVLAGLRPGAIVVMHVGANPKDHSTWDAAALPRVIEAIEARGYSFVTVDQYL
jgi:peptidoglycan/xylan/chitin deacetylase (PgdA/CDA1 family)